MILKTSPFSIQDKNSRDLDNATRQYPTHSYLIREPNVSNFKDDYWEKECDLNPSNPHCLIYDD